MSDPERCPFVALPQGDMFLVAQQTLPHITPESGAGYVPVGYAVTLKDAEAIAAKLNEVADAEGKRFALLREALLQDVADVINNGFSDA